MQVVKRGGLDCCSHPLHGRSASGVFRLWLSSHSQSCLCVARLTRADGMLTSAFISVLSAFLAVCATLLYQQWLNPNAATVIQQHVLPSAPVSTAEINLQQQQEQQEQQQDQEQEQQQDQKSSNTNSPSPPKIDLAQALGLGRVLSSRGEQEEAALVYRVAVSAAVAAHDGDVGTNRDGGEAQHGLGLALLAAGRSEEALEACQEAERLDSSSAAASSCVGVLMTGAGDTAGAVEALRRAVEKAVAAREGDGTIDAMRGRLGGALLDAGEVDEAISVMSGGSSVDPHMAYNLGVAWQTKVGCIRKLPYRLLLCGAGMGRRVLPPIYRAGCQYQSAVC